jgi:hypothetical protein
MLQLPFSDQDHREFENPAFGRGSDRCEPRPPTSAQKAIAEQDRLPGIVPRAVGLGHAVLMFKSLPFDTVERFRRAFHFCQNVRGAVIGLVQPQTLHQIDNDRPILTPQARWLDSFTLELHLMLVLVAVPDLSRNAEVGSTSSVDIALSVSEISCTAR